MSLSFGLNLLTYPADHHTPALVRVARILLLFSGAFTVYPLIQRSQAVRSWFRATPLRFRLLLALFTWPCCNVRRLAAKFFSSRPRCLHVELCPAGARARMAASLPPRSGATRLTVVSDTHGLHALVEVPESDVVVHCGDVFVEDRGFGALDGGRAGLARVEDVGAWLASLPCADAILVGGNHDRILLELGRSAVQAALERGASRVRARRARVTYLCDHSVELGCGLRVHGTPLSLKNSAASENCAFQPDFRPPDDHPVLRAAREALPAAGVDVLVSHGPPRGVLDHDGTGAPLLREYVSRARPPLHLFGHQHQAYGAAYCAHTRTTYVNASTCDGLFAPVHPPVVVDVPEVRALRQLRQPDAVAAPPATAGAAGAADAAGCVRTPGAAESPAPDLHGASWQLVTSGSGDIWRGTSLEMTRAPLCRRP